MSQFMNWYQTNSKVFLTWFATHPYVADTSHSTLEIETKQHPPLHCNTPPPQISLVVANMQDEEL